jgi:hypothetical protein
MEQNNLTRSIISQYIFDKINKKYYAKIPLAVDFEHIIKNPKLLIQPRKNVALYSDHGLNHVVNVSEQIPIILNEISGIHIPVRGKNRSSFMQKYGVILGILHDVGMSDMTSFGREMHGEFATQEVFRHDFAPIFKAMWEENIGNIPGTLLYLYIKGSLSEAPEIVFRELLSLVVCHRKVLVPVEVLNDLSLLRERMQYFIFNSLSSQYYEKTIGEAKKKLEVAKKKGEKKEIEKYLAKLKIAESDFDKAPNNELSHDKFKTTLKYFYKDFHKDSFQWLESQNTELQEFISDVIDTLRVLRCSDALRQRGTELKTSAQFQIFVNQFTANAIYALTSKKGKMYFLEMGDEVSSGEANVASIFFTKEGHLRLELHRGFFHSKAATNKAIDNLAKLIAQISRDIFTTFVRSKKDLLTFQPLENPKILLEETDDFPEFTHLLVERLKDINKNFAEIIKIVPSLKYISPIEYNRYVNGEEITWTVKQKQVFLKKIEASGYKTNSINIKKAFEHARIVTVKDKETLFEAKTFSGLVYFPFEKGLEGFPTGSYSPFLVTPFTPLGNTGVIRGDVRNSTIIAKKSVKLLVLPKNIYLAYWLATYSKEEFAKIIKKPK